MTEDINKLINALRTSSSAERYLALEQLMHYEPNLIIRSVASAWIESDEPERRSLIAPQVKQLQSSSMSQRETSAIYLLLIDHFCIPYLDDALLVSPTNTLISKVRDEIKALDDVIVRSAIGKSEDLSKDGLSQSFIDTMIQATKVSVTMGSNTIQLTEEKLMAFIEINVDAWRNARREIIQLGRGAVKFLIEALKDRDALTRRIAARLLAVFADKRATGSLVSILNDDDVFVRDEAMLALALFDDEDIASQVAEAFAFNRRNMSG